MKARVSQKVIVSRLRKQMQDQTTELRRIIADSRKGKSSFASQAKEILVKKWNTKIRETHKRLQKEEEKLKQKQQA